MRGMSVLDLRRIVILFLLRRTRRSLERRLQERFDTSISLQLDAICEATRLLNHHLKVDRRNDATS